MTRQFRNPSPRWSDDLREAMRRFRDDFQAAFRVIGNHNRDPNDPRLMTALLFVLAVALAVVCLQELLLMLGRQ